MGPGILPASESSSAAQHKNDLKVDMYSVLFTAALFIAIILNDVISNLPQTEILKHLFLGLMATLGMGLLVYKGLDYVGWILLVVPILSIIISLIYTIFYPKKLPPPPVGPIIASTANATAKGPAVNLPETSNAETVCIEYSAPPKIKTAPQCTTLADGSIGPPPRCPASEPASANTNTPLANAAPPAPPAPPNIPVASPSMVSTNIMALRNNLTPVTTCK